MSEVLSLETKVAQLLMFGFSGTKVTPFIEEFILAHNLGGIIHFSRNIESSEQLCNLNQRLQKLSKQSPGGSGLLIAADQEGGTVARLTDGVSVAPSAMALGAVYDETITEEVCSVCGLELAALGINVNFAPVVDVNSNPRNPVIGVRSFGDDPHHVAQQGAAAIRGYQKHIGAVAKHFPGHGDTSLDSHLDLPIVHQERERLDRVELAPFREAIAQNVLGIMTAHVVCPAIEPTPGLPATLSHQILTKLLREEMGYQGLIITDCLEMGAITRTFGTAEAAVMAIEAGADLVLVSQTEHRQVQAFQAILAAVESGRLSEDRIDQSLTRVLEAKKRLLVQETPKLDLVGSPSHLHVIREGVRRSITVVHDQGNLPLPKRPTLVVERETKADHMAEDRLVNMGVLATALKNQGFPHVDSMVVRAEWSLEEQESVLAKASQFEQVIVVTSDAHRQKNQVALVHSLIKAGIRLILVGSRTPYELSEFPEVPTYIAAYGSRPMVWEEVAKVLMGQNEALGKLPVKLIL